MVVSEDKLREAALELDLPFNTVKDLYEQALANGNGIIGLKEFKEHAYKELVLKDLGGAVILNDDEYEHDKPKKKKKAADYNEDDEEEYDEAMVAAGKKKKADEDDDEDEDGDSFYEKMQAAKKKKKAYSPSAATRGHYGNRPDKGSGGSYDKMQSDDDDADTHPDETTDRSHRQRAGANSDESEYDDDMKNRRKRPYRMKSMEEREILKDVLLDLNDKELDNLYDVLLEVEKERDKVEDDDDDKYEPMMKRKKAGTGKKMPADYDYDEDEDEEMTTKRRKKDFDRVNGRIDRLEDLIMEQTKSFTTLAASLTGGASPRNDLHTAVEEVLSQVPRHQASQYASQASGRRAKSEETLPDDAILSKLKEIEEAVQQQSTQKNGMYDMFTSDTLNGGK